METPQALAVSLKDHDDVTISPEAITWSIENNNCKIAGEQVATIASDGNLTISNAGTATIKVTVSRFEDKGVWYAGGTGQIQLTVKQKALTASLTGPSLVTYTGSSDVTLAEGTDYTISGYVLDDNTQNEVNVTATGKLDHPSAGSQNLSVTYTVAGDKAGNYTAPAAANKEITVHKATALTPNTGTITVYNRKAATYSYRMDQLLPTVTAPASLGTVTYKTATAASDPNGYINTVTLDNTKKTLTVVTNNVNRAAEESVAEIQVTIESTNYQDMTATINVNAINPGTVTLTYFPNGGNGTSQTYSYDQGISTTVSGNMFSRTDYVFTGWNTAANGSGTAYAPGVSITLNSSMELYAQWQYTGGGTVTPSEYTLRYNTNGGKKIDSETYKNPWTKDYDELPVPVRAGYVFKGWYRNSTLTMPVTGDVYVNSGVVTLFAKWSDGKDYGPDDTGVSKWLETDKHNAFLSGYPDGSFLGDKNMTRAEVAQMFYSLLLDKDVKITKSFSDVPTDAWYAKAVNTLSSLGMLGGYPDGTFRPDAPITRAEFAAIALAFAYDPASASCSYTDVNTSAWYYTYVAQATTYGWIGGYPDGSFRPNNSITRAEVAVIVNNMLGRDADENYINRNADELVSFVDLSKNHWAYYTIMEATNSHDYTSASSGETWTCVK
ncbi:S-layer homology domain-containing protein [Flintibacter sp. KGMB00164]|uniref:S-layer homology domain-containing protein n=1 Tax=Flintibacter sp. KGMB00164 TaxID=2610895 RepID=UPI001A9B88BA|nr:S-layer homology domain-containing protein [Flintibacter sp. KGMB00164]